MMHIYRIIFTLLFSTAITGCTTFVPPSYDKFSAIAWAKSTEGEIVLREIYRLATNQLSIVHAQHGPNSVKPQAVVMDLDETVLDNSDFQLSLAMSGTPYSEDKFNLWALSRKASPVPGAVDFIRYAMNRGLTVFFVTNRDSTLKNATKANLQSIGVTLPMDIDSVLCVEDRPEWSKNKQTRWNYIQTRYKIIMYVGDSIYDFPISRDSDTVSSDLQQLVQEHWGYDWVLLPNPMYGEWKTYVKQ